MDLKSQLAALTGVAPPPDEPPEPHPPPRVDPLLGEHAHLDEPWLGRLRALRATVPRAPALAARPRLGQARQVTDQLLRILKKAGRKREARELAGLRDAFYSRREKAAWAAVKGHFTELGLSEKAYRGLKQGRADPLKVWAKLERTDPEQLRALGAKRLRVLLEAAR